MVNFDLLTSALLSADWCCLQKTSKNLASCAGLTVYGGVES